MEVKGWFENDEIIMAVSDSGPGIPEDQISNLFKKFSRLSINEEKAQGSGLGLVITRQIVEAHNGNIWVESEVGRGTTFYFSLPILTSEEPYERAQRLPNS